MGFISLMVSELLDFLHYLISVWFEDEIVYCLANIILTDIFEKTVPKRKNNALGSLSTIFPGEY